MGINGLLPLLKSIQVSKHLSEFSGQTLAVDAYVWLHRGVYACPTEIATGKKTTKYVDYAMHRVRLLRHHGIEPYIVFDGGPLPAKKGTEIERRQRREESKARGDALAAQGKHAEAREHYIKCVDVTPQMAYQLIKALRAESVPYVVAPYEADAQLAYLERTGVVSGIITEDSDLLVFGCRHVLFKLDAVTSTITSISRDDFGAVSPSALDSSGISLHGWTDVHFRSMAILSGCDYLPSIPGIGLKTAYTLLRKWDTAERVVRAVRMECKKPVPKDYLKMFRLAERCFLHQRVYDPKDEKLVYLTDIGDDWDEEVEAYVGSDLEPSIARKIAMGDADPVTHLPMEDINPSYVPRVLRNIPLPVVANNSNRKVKSPSSPQRTPPRKGKGKATEKQITGGILSFFGPNPIIPHEAKVNISPRRVTGSKPAANNVNGKGGMAVGRASGKRTLVDVMAMDEDMRAKKKKTTSTPILSPSRSSRFFGALKAEAAGEAISGSSRISISLDNEKENLTMNSPDDDDEEDLELDPDISMEAQPGEELDVEELDIELDDVAQEDGYISPSPSWKDREGDTPDLSSPIRPSSTPIRQLFKVPAAMSGKRDAVADPDDFDFGADAISSPILESRVKAERRTTLNVGRLPLPPSTSRVEVFVLDTPTHASRRPPRSERDGPDLRDCFDDQTSDIDCFEEDSDIDRHGPDPDSTTTPSPSPLTPVDSVNVRTVKVVRDDDGDLDDPEGAEARRNLLRNEAVASGWRNRWALDGKGKGKAKDEVRGARIKTLGLRRTDTTVTPTGRHKPIHPHSSSRLSAGSRTRPGLYADNTPRSALPKTGTSSTKSKAKPLKARNSLVFSKEVKQQSTIDTSIFDSDIDQDGGGGVVIDSSFHIDPAKGILSRAQVRLSEFRCS